MSDFRLTGLMGQSSTLWVMAGFIALLVVGCVRDFGLTLSGHGIRRKEVRMKKAKKTLKVLGFSLLNTIWAIGASVTAVSLSA